MIYDLRAPPILGNPLEVYIYIIIYIYTWRSCSKLWFQKKTAQKTYKYYNEAFNQQSRQKKKTQVYLRLCRWRGHRVGRSGACHLGMLAWH